MDLTCLFIAKIHRSVISIRAGLLRCVYLLQLQLEVLLALLEIVLQLCQVKKLSKVNWGSVSIEFLNGALTGALIGLGINPVATNLGRTLINMVTSIAHSIRTKAKFWSAIGSAVLAGLMTYAVGRYSAATAVITRTVMQSIIATLKTRFSRFSIRAAGVAIKVVF